MGKGNVSAVLAAGLFGNPACVPDRAVVQMKLLEFNKKLLDRLYPEAKV